MNILNYTKIVMEILKIRFQPCKKHISTECKMWIFIQSETDILLLKA